MAQTIEQNSGRAAAIQFAQAALSGSTGRESKR